MSTADSLVSEASRILLGDDMPARMLKQVGGPVAFLALMKYSRKAEIEADLLAYYHVQRGGWNPSGMVDLFAHLGERPPNLTDAFGSFASSHPTPAEREAQIKAEMAKLSKVYEPHIYAGAGHGFLRAQSGQNGANLKATQEAWPTMLAFFAKHLK